MPSADNSRADNRSETPKAEIESSQRVLYKEIKNKATGQVKDRLNVKRKRFASPAAESGLTTIVNPNFVKMLLK